MSISAGQVSVTSTPTLIYETPDGVETCLVVRAGDGTVIGDSTVSAYTGFEFRNLGTSDPGQPLPITLTRFTGALYGFSGSTDTVYYIAADIQ